jgi:hypothetical protein
MGDEGSGEVGWIDGNDVRSRPQQGEGVGDGVAVGERFDGNQDRPVRHVEFPRTKLVAALSLQRGPNSPYHSIFI